KPTYAPPQQPGPEAPNLNQAASLHPPSPSRESESPGGGANGRDPTTELFRRGDLLPDGGTLEDHFTIQSGGTLGDWAVTNVYDGNLRCATLKGM
ncbi:MAG TPA: hypothetical protein DCY13_12700, partial [Verrucomicrobiales bacterium]|nr:hypothetical protein [Verrucomicrobiales bacterium]